MCYFKYITGGLENVQQNKIFKKNKKRTKQRKEPCPADSVGSLMAEMPFVNTDIEDEFVSKYILKMNLLIEVVWKYRHITHSVLGPACCHIDMGCAHGTESPCEQDPVQNLSYRYSVLQIPEHIKNLPFCNPLQQ